jgi:hypothetical protein
VEGTRRVILDLCSGLGGASEAFIQHPNWTVIRIENNPLLEDVPFTHQLDVLNWVDWIDSFPRIDVIWASPPCLGFSNGYSSPRAIAQREGMPYEPDMSLIQACLDIIDYCKPSTWVLENVAGSIKFITPLIGKFQQHISSFFLWGNFPRMVVNLQHKKSDIDVWSSDPLRANKRAKIPRQLSQAFLQAIQEQKQLRDYL